VQVALVDLSHLRGTEQPAFLVETDTSAPDV
jgi:hypothetical protein